MCRVLREGPVLCLNQCVVGVDMRSNVSAMCFLVGCVCALVFKVLWHVVISYFRASMETFMCRKRVCVGVKKFVNLKCVQMLMLCVFLLDVFVHWCSKCYGMW